MEITADLIGAIVAAVSIAVFIVIWITGKFSKLANVLTAAIHKSREEGNSKSAEVHRRVDEVIVRLQQHELDVATNFARKDEIAADFDRVIGAVDKLRASIEGLAERLAKIEP